MASFNEVILLGNLTRDPEFADAKNGGKARCKSGIAVNTKSKAGDKVMFIDITAWDKTAEVLANYCQKGKQVLIRGRLEFETWEDKQGGKRSKHSITVDTLQLLGAKGEVDGGGQGHAAPVKPLPEDAGFVDDWPIPL